MQFGDQAGRRVGQPVLDEFDQRKYVAQAAKFLVVKVGEQAITHAVAQLSKHGLAPVADPVFDGVGNRVLVSDGIALKYLDQIAHLGTPVLALESDLDRVHAVIDLLLHASRQAAVPILQQLVNRQIVAELARTAFEFNLARGEFRKVAERH